MNKNLLQFLSICLVFLISSNSLLAQRNTIKVTDFTIRASDKKVSIDWKTDGATETNYFAIQKSTDGVNYRTVAMVMGPDPKQKNCDCYACSEKFTSKSAKSYYRLVHVDTEGNEQVAAAKTLSTP